VVVRTTRVRVRTKRMAESTTKRYADCADSRCSSADRTRILSPTFFRIFRRHRLPDASRVKCFREPRFRGPDLNEVGIGQATAMCRSKVLIPSQKLGDQVFAPSSRFHTRRGHAEVVGSRVAGNYRMPVRERPPRKGKMERTSSFEQRVTLRSFRLCHCSLSRTVGGEGALFGRIHLASPSFCWERSG